MSRLLLIIYLLIQPMLTLLAQSQFTELVESAFGSDQELINGIQFSNHYGQVDGHPYLLDETFREGTVLIVDQLYENLKIRYNLYSQKVEMEYQFSNRTKIQFMSVPEHMPSFSLEGRAFERIQFGDEKPAYYQVVSTESYVCYIGWRKDQTTARNESFRAYQFSAPKATYWLKLGQDVIPFHDRKSFVQIFPEGIQKDILQMLKQQRYSFKNATVVQAEEMLITALGIYEKYVQP